MRSIWSDPFMKKKLNWFGGTLVVLLVLNIILGFLSYRKDTSFKVEDTRFHLISRNAEEMVFKDQDGEKLTVHMENPDRNQISFATVYSAKYQEKEFKVESDDFFEKGYRILQGEEEVYVESISRSGWITSGEEMPSRSHGRMENLPFDIQMIYGLEEVIAHMGEDVIEGHVTMVLLLLLLSVFAAFLILFPELSWKFEHFLWVEGGEPSELYLTLHRTAGGLLLFLVLGMYLSMVL